MGSSFFEKQIHKNDEYKLFFEAKVCMIIGHRLFRGLLNLQRHTGIKLGANN
jgi:hypothetical protein